MFLDYDGTLREIERTPEAARPQRSGLRCSYSNCEDDTIDLTIISGARLKTWKRGSLEIA